MPAPSILFVCLGNICRSPTAEAVFRRRAADAGLDVHIDSAGTGAWHAGEPPDPRAQAHGERRGYSFAGQVARKIRNKDFDRFDHIFAMDRRNLEDLTQLCPPAHLHKVKLFLTCAPNLTVTDVPDPYYGGEAGFENVLNLIEAASDGLIGTLQ